jgi:TonB family protein
MVKYFQIEVACERRACAAIRIALTILPPQCVPRRFDFSPKVNAMTLSRLVLFAALLSSVPLAAAAVAADQQEATSQTGATHSDVNPQGATRPVPIGVHSVSAFYPDVARRLSQEGDVIVSFLVHTDGSVANIAVARSSGFPLLDTAAVTAVSTWRYMPAMQGGKPVDYHDKALLQFRLRGSPDVPPAIFNIIPAPMDAYPPDALASKQQGATQIVVLINENGSVSAVQVVATSGSQSLDDAAMALVKQKWHFKAAAIDDKSMKSAIELIINWTLPSTGASH